MAETAEKKSEDDGVDCEDIRDGAYVRGDIPRKWRWTVKISGDGGGGLWRNPKMMQMSGEAFQDGEGLV